MLTDELLVKAVRAYRDHPEVEDRHGPASMDELARFMADKGMLDRVVSRSALHYRLNQLVQAGLLGTGGRPGNGNGKRLFTPGLFVTKEGEKLLEGNGNGHD